MMPLLLDKGLLVVFPEGKGYCMGLLIRIIKEAKNTLNTWICRLISVLIEGMSALEPQSLQYMQFHTAKLNIKEDELETMRVKMAQASPLQEALNQCIQSTDFGVYVDQRLLLADVIVRVSDYIQHGIGLATRTAAANSLTALLERYPDEIKSRVCDPTKEGTGGPGGGGNDGRSNMKHSAVDYSMNIGLVLEKVFYGIYDILSTTSVIASKALSASLVATMGSLVKIIKPSTLQSACLKLLKKQQQLDVASTVGSGSMSSGGEEDFLAVATCINLIVSRSGDRLNTKYNGSTITVAESELNIDSEEVNLEQNHVVGDDQGNRDAYLWKLVLSRAYIGMFDKIEEGEEDSETFGQTQARAIVSLWTATWVRLLGCCTLYM